MKIHDRLSLRERPRRTDVPTLDLNGVDTIIKTGLMFDFTRPFNARICFSSISAAEQHLFGARDGAALDTCDFAMYLLNRELFVVLGGVVNKFVDADYGSGPWYTAEVKREGGLLSMTSYNADYTLKEDPVPVAEGTDFHTTRPLTIGARHDGGAATFSSFFYGELAGASLSTAFNYPMEEQKGSILYNALIDGVASDATLETTSTTLIEARAERTDDLYKSHNDSYGYRITNGVYIPGRTDIVPSIPVQT